MTLESLKNTYWGYHLGFHKLRNSYNDISKTVFEGNSEGIKLIPFTQEQNSQLTLLFPATALGAFSIELGLKFLLFKNHGVFPKTHNLQTLFELLPESLKASILQLSCETIKISSNEFAMRLFAIRGHFELWRYLDASAEALNPDLQFIVALEGYVCAYVQS